MRLVTAGVAAALGILFQSTPAHSQSERLEVSAHRVSVPRVISVSGEFVPTDGRAPHPVETVTLRVYSQQSDGTPLWEETQAVAVDSSGFYKVLLGATQSDGVPVEVFAGGARWLSTKWNRAGEVEGPRTALTSVPYALRAADAETLGGLPASAYQLAGRTGPAAPATSSRSPSGDSLEAAASLATSIAPKAVMAGTANYLAKYVNGADVGNSSIYELNGLTGFNTHNPQDIIHSRFTSSDGQWVGLVVQNLGNTATSYSGMLFRDQNGAVAQFQGFNNSTHEYRINNISSGGSINFMLGGASKFKIDPTGKVLIGTTTPETGVYVQGALEILQPNSNNGLLVRKTGTSAFSAPIHARSGPDVPGPLVKAIAGFSDSSDSGGNMAVLGRNNTNGGVGVVGWASSTNGVGVYGLGTLYAGQFSGDVTVSGTLTKGGGAFQIDHPLDPENKYLRHSFVESPDMMNVYNGNVALDSRGEATVILPEWFEALNNEFRYQLTSIGAPGPNLYVAEEISGNQFRIAGGTPNAKVSWLVTGIRKDAWANANRIQVEAQKTTATEKGRYLHPEAHGQAKERGFQIAGAAEVTR